MNTARKEHSSGGTPSVNAISRRTMLSGSLAAGAALAGTVAIAPTEAAENEINADYKVQNRRIRQSVMGWCFDPMPTKELLQASKEIGLIAAEGISAEYYDFANSIGLKISLVSSHGFAKGPLSRDNHPYCIEKLTQGIDLCKKYDCRNLITFTGMREKGIDDATADKNCIECWKQVIDYAEKNEVNLCLEHLNSRDNTHPMKGHPGYYGDNVDHCVDLIKRVDSPRMKLLFDIYHVQIMNGDVIRRIRQYKDYIAHYHTAGNPGRGELDDKQEINYPAIMHAILETGYTGYVTQEFIPTWEDKIAALRHAAKVCDV